MIIGELLLITAAATAAGCGLTAFLTNRSEALERISRWCALLLFALLTVTLLFLVFLFLTSDMTSQYVWSHSSRDLGAGYKLVAVWAGGQGGLVLWTWFMSLAMVVETVRERRWAVPADRALFRTICSVLLLIFILVLLASGIFGSTSPSDLAARPDGLGMNLSLQSPEMALHPPVVFAGYAFCIVLFASSIAQLVRPSERWRERILPWARITFLLLSTGIAIGGIWAYYELGWGGFWAWDPVETASLVPWLIVAAFLHAQTRLEERPVLVPLLGALAFTGVLFSAFLTRTGGLWGSSVHTYGASEAGNLGERLVAILANDHAVAGFFILLAAVVAVTVWAAIGRWRESRTAGPVREDERGQITLATVGILLVVASFLVLLLIRNNSLDQSSNFAEFTEKVGLLSIAVTLLLAYSLVRRFATVRSSLAICAVTLLSSVALAAVGAVTGGFEWFLAMTLPSCLLALTMVAFTFSPQRGDLAGKARVATASLIHLGFLLVIVGFLVSTVLAVVPAEGYPAPMGLGDSVEVGSYTVRLVDVVERSEGANIAVEAHLAIYSGPSLVDTVVLVDLYPPEGGGRIQGDVYVHKTLSEDLYISFDRMAGTEIMLEARLIPLVNLVWVGAIALGAGVAGRILLHRRTVA